MSEHYTNARLSCEALDVFCGQYEDDERTDATIGFLLAQAAQARATLAVADELRRMADSLDDVVEHGAVKATGSFTAYTVQP